MAYILLSGGIIIWPIIMLSIIALAIFIEKTWSGLNMQGTVRHRGAATACTHTGMAC